MRQNESVEILTEGEGSGVRSVMAARYGEGRFDPYDSEELRLVVDMFDRREDVVGGRWTGDVIEVIDWSDADSTGGLAS